MLSQHPMAPWTIFREVCFLWLPRSHPSPVKHCRSEEAEARMPCDYQRVLLSAVLLVGCRRLPARPRMSASRPRGIWVT